MTEFETQAIALLTEIRDLLKPIRVEIKPPVAMPAKSSRPERPKGDRRPDLTA